MCSPVQRAYCLTHRRTSSGSIDYLILLTQPDDLWHDKFKMFLTCGGRHRSPSPPVSPGTRRLVMSERRVAGSRTGSGRIDLPGRFATSGMLQSAFQKSGLCDFDIEAALAWRVWH